MQRTVSRLFDTRGQAENAIRDLESAGFPHQDLSIVAAQRGGTEERSFADRDVDHENDAAGGAGKGAATGGVIGAGAGLLAGLGILAIPGLGPVVAAGWLVSTAVGAVAGAAAGGAAGGILGALKDAGIKDEDAHVYAEGVRRGGALVSVRADEARADEAQAILDRSGGVDASVRGPVYRQEGWTTFDENAPIAPSSEPLARGPDPLI
jgi:hypothetical protein